MNVSNFHIQHIIKAYGQRIGRRSLLGLKSSSQAKPSPDIISISTEAKRRQVLDQITSDIVSRAKRQETNTDIDEHLFEKVGEKLADPLELITGQEKTPDFRFRLLSDKEGNGEGIKELSINDLKKMVENLYSGETNNGE